MRSGVSINVQSNLLNTEQENTEHQSVLCFNTKLKTIFQMDKINRKTLGWSVIH